MINLTKLLSKLTPEQIVLLNQYAKNDSDKELGTIKADQKGCLVFLNKCVEMAGKYSIYVGYNDQIILSMMFCSCDGLDKVDIHGPGVTNDFLNIIFHAKKITKLIQGHHPLIVMVCIKYCRV